jgi:hypothetical protein
MKRRDFLQASAQTAVVAGCATSAALATSTACSDTVRNGRQLYEWRTFRLTDKAKHAKLHKYLESAFLPAAKRSGLGPVGVFTEIGPEETPSLHMLIVYPDAAAVSTAREAIENDGEYKQAAADYLATKKEDAAFEQVDSWLLLAFAAAPQITPPAKKARVFEVRTYKNHGEDRARAKIAMFNDGEINIFPKCGFENVFFGEVLAGTGQPALKYMLAAPDMAANEAGWKTFIDHPDFVKMRNDPKYADTQPEITKLFLEPTNYSQI